MRRCSYFATKRGRIDFQQSPTQLDIAICMLSAICAARTYGLCASIYRASCRSESLIARRLAHYMLGAEPKIIASSFRFSGAAKSKNRPTIRTNTHRTAKQYNIRAANSEAALLRIRCRRRRDMNIRDLLRYTAICV